jgi:hypothetical protein
MATKSTEELVLDKMDLLISLILHQAAGPSIKERATLLQELGLSPSQIGKLIGRPANYVSALLGTKRKKK